MVGQVVHGRMILRDTMIILGKKQSFDLGAECRRILAAIRHSLPEGNSLPADVWQRRHRVILWLLWLHAIGIMAWGLGGGYGLPHSLFEASAVAAAALLAGWKRAGREFRAVVASIGLVTASAIVVHLSGGYIEAHFHFFVMVIIIALYQDWLPFLVAIGYVVVHHGVVGVLDPHAVYNHPGAWANPWKWAAIHGTFVLAASVASAVHWRLNEAARAHAELLLHSAGEGILGLDLDGNVTVVNAAAARMLGYTPEALRGRALERVLRPARPDGSPYESGAWPVMAALAGGEAHSATGGLWRRRDGSYFPVEYVSTPVRDRRGIVGAMVTFRDITDRKQAQDALAAQKEFLGQVIDASPSLIFVKDRAGRFTLVNKAVADLYGTTVPELLGKTDADFNPKAAETDDFRAADQVVIDTLQPRFIPEEPVTDVATGETRWYQTIKVPLSSRDGEPQVLGVATDITERKRVEEALRQSEEQLRQSQKMEAVGQLAGGVAHDFNNLLTVINGFGDLLRDRLAPGDPLHGPVDEIRKAGERAAALTYQLLAFSRRQMLRPVLLDLNEAVADAETLLRRLIGEDVELVTVLRPALGCVQVDPGQLQQVILNLVVNARDAMPQGGRLTLETAKVDLDATCAQQRLVQPGPYVMLAVSDTGCGMDADTQAHIFEPFFTTKEQGKGTGLGLATVYGIIKQSGGHVWVYSEPGIGTTFKIYLPRVEAAGEAGDPVAPPTALPCGSETILLVEDEDQVRTLVEGVLQDAGYTVLVASRGDAALPLAAQHAGRIDLLLTDVVMPGMSGRDLANRLTPDHPGMDVLYMSGYTDDAIVHHGVLDSGVVLLQKPFSPAALLYKVREILDAAEATAAPAAQAAPVPAPAAHTLAEASVPLRILLVDDQFELAALTREALALDGHAVVVVASGEAALAHLAAEPCDLVISDVNLGAGMNGWDLAAAVGARHPGVRIVLTTGQAPIDPAKASFYGVEAVLEKPYRLADLRRVAAPAASASAA
jgi:PAS domain S-box-containing protein